MQLSNVIQIREADRIMIEDLAYPGVLLMETAGRKSAEFLLEQYPECPHFLLLVGPGNNGGDGFVIARYLKDAGKSCSIWL